MERAITLAERLLAESQQIATRAETNQLQRLGKLIEDEQGRALVQLLTDDVLRIHDARRAARRFRDVVDTVGIPSSLGRLDALMMRVGAAIAPYAPRLLMPLVTRRIRNETHGVVLSAKDPEFADHVAHRRSEGVRINVNVLGEAILSDAEADKRLASVRSRLARPDVDYVSVKISAICANLDPLAFDDSVARVSERMRLLYRDAMSAADRGRPAKFVNLDMEEFKDLALTVATFTSVLDEPEFAHLEAGIVLQAYLPDSHAALEHLGHWAAARRARSANGDNSGGRIKIRIVKGANLAMEQVDAETHGWQQAPYLTKAEVDASYKRMLDSSLRPEWRDALRIGLASHNLFDIAWGLILRDELDDPRQIELEMLEGMAPAQARAVNAAAHGLLLYAPVVAPDDVDSSIAYLSRRLDENTSPDNFLRALFTLRPGTVEFAEQAERFRTSVADRHTIHTTSHRCHPAEVDPTVEVATGEFDNEPDSDFTVEGVREAALSASGELSPVPHIDAIDAIDAVVATAAAAATRWAVASTAERRALLDAVAATMADQRNTTLAVMADEAGKTIREGDPEVSEGIDFARYYGSIGAGLVDDLRADGVEIAPLGVVLVVAPWNFPYAIPAGGVCAALAAGNSVILKPAPETRRTAWLLANQLWEAGVPHDLLQYVACDDNEVGQHLVTHADIATVVLTGSYDTAKLFVGWKPEMRLLAETSGKNALVITAAADIDGALKDLVRAAFGHAGQKCSAASLAIVEAGVYDDPAFHQRLADAVTSLVVGWPTEPATMMGPLINPPSGNLRRAFTTLDQGERWLVEPHPLGRDDPTRLWSPGVKVGVAPGSWFHLTECFGPVLGVMRADDLDHAIRLQNATPYGLTGGIHSLDPAEVRHWLDRVEVGNAYINRHITGAVVQRQPFGGWKRSSIGCGVKAGGPDYVLSLTRVHAAEPSPTVAAESFERWWTEWFSQDHDPSGLTSERNILRYRPLGPVVLRFDDTVATGTVQIAIDAARRCGVRVHVSNAATETETAMLDRVSSLHAERVRSLSAVSDDIRIALLERSVGLDTTPVSDHGRLELGRWLKEQAVSETTHRYGRLTASIFESAPVAASGRD
ncbi:MAG: bifunctional proline dehydrogenase/L-glutamate gamma-semialdehyde dehydrogenase [Ilumatobacteraceae bacterium]